MIRIEDVIDTVEENRPGADIDLIRRAYLFSAVHHRGQTRASGEPYLVHPLEVAKILADMRLDETSVSTGLLHDVVEDTLVDLDTIRSYFGGEITQLVDGLTKIAHVSDLSREKQQAENVRKMVLAMTTDVRVVLIKLADRLHNMRTMQYLRPEKRERISQETLDIYAPIAHRLGMGKMRSELEDLAFQNLYPAEYKRLAKEVDARRPELEATLEKVKATIAEKLTENEVPFVQIEGRVKRLYSLWKSSIPLVSPIALIEGITGNSKAIKSPKIVYGFFPYWNLKYADQLNIQSLTHFAYFALDLNLNFCLESTRN